MCSFNYSIIMRPQLCTAEVRFHCDPLSWCLPRAIVSISFAIRTKTELISLKFGEAIATTNRWTVYIVAKLYQKRIYIALFYWTSHSRRSDMDHTVLPANYTILAFRPHLISVHQMALPVTCDGVHLIAVYYSSIDPERMKGRVGVVGWPIADGLCR